MGEQVRRLDVAMNDASTVSPSERLARLKDTVGDLDERERAQLDDRFARWPAEHRPVVLTAEPLHHEKRPTRARAHVEDLHDVLALDLRRDARFTEEALDVRVPDRLEELQRDVAASALVVSGKDETHPALAEDPGDAVAPANEDAYIGD
jgi:hypothetical protein